MKKILSRTQSLAKSRTILTGSGSNNAASEAPTENNTPQTAPLQPEHSQIEKALALINTFHLCYRRHGHRPQPAL